MPAVSSLGALVAAAYVGLYLYLRWTCRGEDCLMVGALAGPWLLLVTGLFPTAAWAEWLLLALNVLTLYVVGWGVGRLWSRI